MREIQSRYITTWIASTSPEVENTRGGALSVGALIAAKKTAFADI
jgi:hypothetical protein